MFYEIRRFSCLFSKNQCLAELKPFNAIIIGKPSPQISIGFYAPAENVRNIIPYGSGWPVIAEISGTITID